MVECKDKNCFVHGNLRVRGQTLVGKVVSSKPRKTVIIERSMTTYHSKYKRYSREHSRIPAHNPPCLNAKKGDIVKIAETRKISRTKAWTVYEIIKRAEE